MGTTRASHGSKGFVKSGSPIFLALPILRHSEVLGVVVVQRAADDPIERADTELAAALVAPFALALASDRARRRQARTSRELGGGGREVRLRGKRIVGGKALGRAELLPAIEGEVVGDETKMDRAFEAVTRRLSHRLALVMAAEAPPLKERLAQLELTLLDERFRRAAIEETTAKGIAAGLASLARRYSLAPLQTADGEELAWLEQRAAEVAALCRLVFVELQDRALVRPGGALLFPEAPGALLCLDLLDRRPSAVIIADRMAKSRLGVHLLERGAIPTMASVGGLYAWVREGDPLVVDADAELVHIHPSPELAARIRRR